MKNKPAGCLVAAVIAIILLGVVGVAAFFWVFNARMVVDEDEARESVMMDSDPSMAFSTGDGSENGTLTLQRNELVGFTVPESGEKITRERFAAFMLDETATELARSTFREVADGAWVSWLLRTENIGENRGLVEGRFHLPWEIVEENRTSSSAISVRAQFSDVSHAALLKLRRGEWAIVQGELSFSGNSVVLKDARLAPAPEE